MRLISAAFEDGSEIPKKYTEDGNNISPPLRWVEVPKKTMEFALTVDDPDAPRADAFVHWVIYRIPVEVLGLSEGQPRDERVPEPINALQGLNDFPGSNRLGYRGPAPPKGHGIHHYRFRLYALDVPLQLSPRITRDALTAAMTGHVLAHAELVGTYQRK